MIVRHPPPVVALREHALRLAGDDRDYDELLRLAQGRSLVLLGEASHGTHEFYAMRAAITRRLLREQGFDAVVVEGDWPDMLELDAWVRGAGAVSVDEALEAFQRFPDWMWRNHVVRAFAEDLREHNLGLPEDRRVGIYGMDLYSLYRSAEAVVEYLQSVDPEQAQAARRLYRALDHVRDPQAYGYEAAHGLRPACREAAAGLLVELARRAPDYLASDGMAAADRQFHAERNAFVVLNAEHYYRAMFEGRANTWNLRDAHMVETIQALRRQLRSRGRAGRLVVWAHNSHLGDARATEMGLRGEWNVGQLLRQAEPEDALLVGFTTYTGHVTAARDWNLPAERRWVRPALDGSCERLFYESRLDRFFLPLQAELAESLRMPMLERAIGVVYRPETERASHYFHASLSSQFDALFHLDETTAVEPLASSAHWKEHEPVGTFPSGF